MASSFIVPATSLAVASAALAGRSRRPAILHTSEDMHMGHSVTLSPAQPGRTAEGANRLNPEEVYADILPALLHHARFAFRMIRSPAEQDDRIQELLGIAWTWVVSLARRGKDARRFRWT